MVAYGNGNKYYSDLSPENRVLIASRNVSASRSTVDVVAESYGENFVQATLSFMEWDPKCELLALCYADEAHCSLLYEYENEWKTAYVLPHDYKPTSLAWSPCVGKCNETEPVRLHGGSLMVFCLQMMPIIS